MFGCPCESCKKRNPHQTPVAIIHELEGGKVSLEQCPHCGFTETIEWWEHLSMDILYSKEKYATFMKGR